MEGLWTSRLCPDVFPHGTLNNRAEASVVSLRGWCAFLRTELSGNGLISPGKAASILLRGTQSWCGEEALGSAEQATRLDELLRQQNKLHALFNFYLFLQPKPRGGGMKKGFVFGLH